MQAIPGFSPCSVFYKRLIFHITQLDESTVREKQFPLQQQSCQLTSVYTSIPNGLIFMSARLCEAYVVKKSSSREISACNFINYFPEESIIFIE
jgi:hypothetical protein